MYRRVSIQLLPLGPVASVATPAPAPRRGQRSFLWLLLAAGLAAAFLTAAYQMRRAADLERELERERLRTTTMQQALLGEARTAGQRSAALEQDLRAVEEEAERLYDVVRAMRTLGEQLRERVGLPASSVEPLPELPQRRPAVIPPATTAQTASDETGTILASLPALPANTGPWPSAVVAGLPPQSGAARIAATGDSIARQWDAWQRLGQAIDDALGRRSRASRPSIRPAYGVITSWFGRRAGFWGNLAVHTGIDISLPIGTAVAATGNGTVSFAGVRSGFGYTVEIQHESGLMTLYGHLSRPLVSAGQRVTQGQIVALSGNSGISTGPHLHYEVRLNGIPVDPSRYW